MITHIRMENFKSWKNSGEVKLAPLTGFFGTNSSGKSSLLQMLLLLKQTVGSDEPLFLGDENSLVNLGNFREAIHGHNLEAMLGLELGCKFPKPFTVEIYGRKRRDSFHKGHFPVSVDNFTFYTVIGQNNGKLRIAKLSYWLESARVIDSYNQMDRFKPQVHWNKGRTIHSDSFNQMYEFKQEVKNCYGVPLSRDESEDESLRHLSSAFENFF